MISYLDIKTGRESAVTLSLPSPQPYLIGGAIMAKSVVSKRSGSSQVKKVCPVCGTTFWVKPSHAEKRKTCSRKCMGLSQIKKVTLPCSFCGKDVERCPSQLKQYRQYKSKNVFCNKSCMTKYHTGDGNPNRRKENEVELKCQCCGQTFYRPQWLSFNPGTKKPIKFCSRECYRQHRLKESGAMFSCDVEVVCAWCGKLKKVTSHNYRKQKSFFCDALCQGEYQSVFFSGKSAHGYKGGFALNDRPSYKHYSGQIDFKVETRMSIDGLFLEVKCSYCGKWFEPTRKYLFAVMNRFRYNSGDLNFYCSAGCKKACPVFWQRKYPKGFKRASSREVSPDLRQMCLERDGWECQRCGKTEPPLHCHHIDGAVQNKIISNDLENVITLCKACHKEVHKQDGCRYHELQCKEKESCAA
jgi:hypothetical protein